MGISDNDGRVLLGKTLALFQVEDGQRYGLLLRDNRVLCAVPEERATAEKAFSLYQPQRRKARALASTFRLATRAGVHLRVLKPWIVKDSGTPGPKSVDWVDPSSSPGVLVGSTGHLCERAVVVLRVEGEWQVCKVAFGAEGERILGIEAKMLQELAKDFSNTPTLASFEGCGDAWILRMPWQDGKPWDDHEIQPLLDLLESWSGRGAAKKLTDFPEWEWIRSVLEDRPSWRPQLDKISRMSFCPSIRHGDLTRPNLRRPTNGGLIVHDWERGQMEGIPGPDLVHFLIQDALFRTHMKPRQVVRSVMDQLSAPEYRQWLNRSGWAGQEQVLMAVGFALNTGANYIDQNTLLDALELETGTPLHGTSPLSHQNALDSTRAKFPIISIVTPTYHQLELLKQCTASVADQVGDFTVEHLIHDAGTGAEFDQWATSQSFAKCISEPDDGMYDAINRGFKRATGDIVAWLNSDEQYLPGTLQRVAEYFRRHPEVDILIGDVILVDHSLCPLAYRKAISPTLGHIRHSHLSTFSAATFVRRKVLEAGHFLDTRWKTIADAVWIERLLSEGYRVAILSKPLSTFAMLGSNLGQSKRLDSERRKWEEELKATNPLKKRFYIYQYRLQKLFSGAYFPRKITVEAYSSDGPVRSRESRLLWGLWSGARNDVEVQRLDHEGSFFLLPSKRYLSRFQVGALAIFAILIAISSDFIKSGESVKAPMVLLFAMLMLALRAKPRHLIVTSILFALVSVYAMRMRPTDVIIVRMVTFVVSSILAILLSYSLALQQNLWVNFGSGSFPSV